LKLDVKQSVLEKAGFENKYFDIVTLFATLEHVPDPSALLREVGRIIKNDGLLVVSAPTIPFYLNLVRSKWRMFIGDHYYFFTDASMANLSAKANFSLISSLYLYKSVDLNTISARLAEEWQPNNLGSIGKLLRKLVMKMNIGEIRFPLNLFDAKIYIARPNIAKEEI
jgi:SAM-dependent methyltransferase